VGSIPDSAIGHRGRYITKKIQTGRSWVRFPIVPLDTEADIELKNTSRKVVGSIPDGVIGHRGRYRTKNTSRKVVGSIPDGVFGHRGRYRTKKIHITDAIPSVKTAFGVLYSSLFARKFLPPYLLPGRNLRSLLQGALTFLCGYFRPPKKPFCAQFCTLLPDIC